MIRIPAKRGLSTRVELRNPDPSCNPYLEIAAILMAGLDGVKNKIAAPAPTEENLYKMSAEEMASRGIQSLPASLEEAINELEKSDVMKAALGDHCFAKYIEGKRGEWDQYRIRVSGWEIKEYLGKY